MGTRLMFAACWAVLLLTGVAAALFPTRDDPLVVNGIGVAIAVACGFFLIRSFRWTVIDVHRDGLVIRGVLSDSEMRLTEIDRFLVVPVEGEDGEPQAVLAVRTRAGQTRMFAEFVSSRDARGFSVERLAAQLNTAITSFAPPS